MVTDSAGGACSGRMTDNLGLRSSSSSFFLEVCGGFGEIIIRRYPQSTIVVDLAVEFRFSIVSGFPLEILRL